MSMFNASLKSVASKLEKDANLVKKLETKENQIKYSMSKAIKDLSKGIYDEIEKIDFRSLDDLRGFVNVWLPKFLKDIKDSSDIIKKHLPRLSEAMSLFWADVRSSVIPKAMNAINKYGKNSDLRPVAKYFRMLIMNSFRTVVIERLNYDIRFLEDEVKKSLKEYEELERRL